MPMSEYELSLVMEAKSGKKKPLENLFDSFHDQLVLVIERELGTRDKAKKIIRKVKSRVKTEIKQLIRPVDFERMVVSITIEECGRYPRVAANGAATGFARPQNGWNRPQAGFPLPAAENGYRAPARPVVPGAPDHSPAAQQAYRQPFRDHPIAAPVRQPYAPPMQNPRPVMPAHPAAPAPPNNRRPIQNPVRQDMNPKVDDRGLPMQPKPQHPSSSPVVFRELNMASDADRHTPAVNSPRHIAPGNNPQQQSPVPVYPQPNRVPVNQNNAAPIPRPWADPQPKADRAEKPDFVPEAPKTELLAEEPKTELLAEEPKTELLVPGSPAPQEDEPKTVLLTGAEVTEKRTDPLPDDEKTEPEEKTASLPDKGQEKTVPLPEQGEEKTAPLSEEGSEKTVFLPEEGSEKTEPKTDPVPEGELLFKPDDASAPDKEPPKPPVMSKNIPKIGLLVCTKGENAGENFSLIAGRNRVGVTENCHVRIKDASLTEDYNFEIDYDERRESFTVIPGKLSSKLFINNDYVDTAIFIQPHDTIKTGNSEFLLVSFQ